jgi:phage tail-like protein
VKKIQIGLIFICGLLTPMLGVAKKEVGDPLIGFYCALEIQGVIAGYFSECSGIGSENEVIEHKVVNEQGVEVVLKIPGRLKNNDITLKRGITSDQDIWAWRQMVVEGDVSGARKNGSVIMYDQEFNEVARWNFEQAWPASITGSTSLGVEELKIVHEGIERVN